jgi:hypothetical protein
MWLSTNSSLPTKTSPTGLRRQKVGNPVGESFADCFKQLAKAPFPVVRAISARNSSDGIPDVGLRVWMLSTAIPGIELKPIFS